MAEGSSVDPADPRLMPAPHRMAMPLSEERTAATQAEDGAMAREAPRLGAAGKSACAVASVHGHVNRTYRYLQAP
jgi:hypothetical protein